MTEKEFKELLREVFDSHTLMKNKEHHTVNELLHCLRYDEKMKEFNFNINVIRSNGDCISIPTIDAFVNLGTLSVWFDYDSIEYEHDYIDDRGFLFYFDYLTITEVVL